MNERKYLISIALGPVQDFIASARRSRDLWFGSWLLSELSKAAAKSIVEQNGELIFPKITKDTDLEESSDFNVVNKILAEISENPVDVGNKVKVAIDERLVVIRNEAYKKVLTNKYFLKDVAEKQVADLVEFFWTAVERTENYEDDRNKVEKLFSARKATRNFDRVTWGDNVPKSSLDGQRESVLMEELYKEVQEGRISKQKLRVDYGVKEGERLCGIGLLKRHGKVETKDKMADENYQDRFFSTSHVASLPLLQRLNDKGAVTDYISILSGLLTEIEPKQLYKILGRVPENLKHNVFGGYDGHLLFEERLSEFFSDKIDLQKAKEALLGVPEKGDKPAIKGFLEKAFGKNTKPLPYYALVLADGDFMGKAIDKQETKDNHQKLSGKLSEFSGSVRETVERDGQGSLIYAGGDDVLAFVGLHKVLDYADKLAKDFKTKLEKFEFDEKDKKKTPTLSVGIAIVHHLEPLEDALELVRSAEKAAKSVVGKNALAVMVDKRSGASRIAKGTWGTLDKRLETFIKWHCENSIPDGAAYELRDLAYRLEIPENAPEALRRNLTEAKEKEAKRILKRKKKDFGESGIGDETIESLGQFLKDIEKTKHPNEDSIAILADELIIARIFADAKNLAEGK
ncbi:MAG: type III-B CRISPR-associated protein Cas10/Cmr2 [Pyrinomonadaceae bacterium]|jgi:CRISPR-associated protein Cmr2|nr:type III-B CRISPR-associated protein Cas10/Cmr2 [Pyrinomonadaceae bacterium]